MSVTEVFMFIVSILAIILTALGLIWCIIGLCILLNGWEK